MTRTDEQRAYATQLGALVRPVLGERVRLIPDAEGFPMVPGAMGRIEYLGGRPEGERLHVFTDRRRIVAKLLAVPGVHRGQMGDHEARLWFAPDDAAALAAVARIIRPRTRRPATAGNLAALALTRPGAAVAG